MARSPRRVSRGKSRRRFSRNARPHPKNSTPSFIMRGGRQI